MEVNRPVSPLEEYPEKSYVHDTSDLVSTSSDAPETELRYALVRMSGWLYLQLYLDKPSKSAM
jgi:hypothetical protein